MSVALKTGFSDSARAKRPLVDSEEAKQKILAEVKEIAELEDLVFLDRVLVAKWMPEKSGSIINPDQMHRENKWQGKIGLVIKLGPAAFQDDDQAGSFYGAKCEVGDWVWFSIQDAGAADFRPVGSFEKYPCFLLRDKDIIGKVPRPDFWW